MKTSGGRIRLCDLSSLVSNAIAAAAQVDRRNGDVVPRVGSTSTVHGQCARSLILSQACPMARRAKGLLRGRASGRDEAKYGIDQRRWLWTTPNCRHRRNHGASAGVRTRHRICKYH